MYLDHFNLEEPPFDFSPRPNFIYWTPRHQAVASQIVEHLLYQEGHAVLLGEVDMGKTQFVKTLLEGLPPVLKKAHLYQVALGPSGLVQSICNQLGIAPEDEGAIEEIASQMLQYVRRGARKKKILMIIDNAAHLQEADMQVLAIVAAEEASRLQILLVGPDRLESVLLSEAAEMLRPKITFQARLPSFNRTETQDYIEYRLRQAKCPKPGQLFSAAAGDAIYALSAGVPRLINGLCDRALTYGQRAGLRKIDVSVVLEAKDERLPVEAFVAL